MIKINPTVLAFAISLLLPITSFSQSIGINDDNSEPDERAILDVKSNSKGVLLPRLTDEERDSLFIDVPFGMLIFNTTDNEFQVFMNNKWYPFSLGTPENAKVCPEQLNDSRDGQTYDVVALGAQCWMAEDLKYDQDSYGIDSCYNNNPANCTEYGRLYSWAAVMQSESSSTSNPSGVQGICPDGWHLPSRAEWLQLTTYIGGAGEGGELKEIATSHWYSPNTGATNSTGFTALGSGIYDDISYFHELKEHVYYWTSALYDIGQPYYFKLNYDNANLDDGYMQSNNLGSVRCVRDNYE